MKIRHWTFFLIALGFYTKALAIPDRVLKKTRDYSTVVDSKEKALLLEKSQRVDNYKTLQLAKKALLLGDLTTSKFYLKRVSIKYKEIRLVARRLKALIAFIENDFERTLDQLDHPEIDLKSSYTQICLLKIITKFAINKADLKLKKDLERCQAMTERYSSNNQQWLSNMALLKFGKIDQLKRETRLRRVYDENDLEGVRLWLTTALYTNREDLISPYLSNIPAKAYESASIRELLALIYYRLSDKKRAFDLVEDLTTPNAENIKGNLNLFENKKELAFGHYKLALKKKENSKNALERALPLSWDLGQWEDGEKFLSQILDSEIDPLKKLALKAAFFIQQGKIKNAQENIEILRKVFDEKLPTEVDLMDTYVALRGKSKNLGGLINSAFEVCKMNDGLHCWLFGQLITWENFPETIARKDPTPFPNSFSIADLKAQWKISPIDEAILIEQRDIEELDSKDLKIRK